jgi:hypothetical protein
MGNKTELYGSATMHEVQFLMNDQWGISQEIRHFAFQESFVILPCKYDCLNVVTIGNHLQELEIQSTIQRF